MKEKNEPMQIKVKISFKDKEYIVNISCNREVSYDDFVNLCYNNSRSQCKLFLDITASDFFKISQLTYSQKQIVRAKKFLDYNDIPNNATFLLEPCANSYRSDAYFYGDGFSFCAISRTVAFRFYFWDRGDFSKRIDETQQPILGFDMAADYPLIVVKDIGQYFHKIKVDTSNLGLVINDLVPSHPMLKSTCKSEQALLGVLMWLLTKKIHPFGFDFKVDLELAQLLDKISFFYKRISEPCIELSTEFFTLKHKVDYLCRPKKLTTICLEEIECIKSLDDNDKEIFNLIEKKISCFDEKKQQELIHVLEVNHVITPFSFFPNRFPHLRTEVSEHQVFIEANDELTTSSCNQV